MPYLPLVNARLLPGWRGNPLAAPENPDQGRKMVIFPAGYAYLLRALKAAKSQEGNLGRAEAGLISHASLTDLLISTALRMRGGHWARGPGGPRTEEGQARYAHSDRKSLWS